MFLIELKSWTFFRCIVYTQYNTWFIYNELIWCDLISCSYFTCICTIHRHPQHVHLIFSVLLLLFFQSIPVFCSFFHFCLLHHLSLCLVLLLYSQFQKVHGKLHANTYLMTHAFKNTVWDVQLPLSVTYYSRV